MSLAMSGWELRLVLIGLILGNYTLLNAADPQGVTFFEQKIRPVLAKHCYSCHSQKAKKLRGGLLLDTRAGLRKGGDTGPAVVPNKPGESLIIESLKHESFEMPPSGKLPNQVITDFEKWIKMGAPDPRDGIAEPVTNKQIDIEAGRRFWSFQPIAPGPLPNVKDGEWTRNAIDHYIQARFESQQISPQREADRQTLIRRLYFDLIGLPPKPEAVTAFLADHSANAAEKLVDGLLASPRFGERWGRHWLDVARFSQSTGGGRSLLYHQAWRYRDYVIKSFNEDKPYDQFIIEQIAGDLLTTNDYRRRTDQLTATAFLLLGATNYEQQDKDLLRMDVIDEQIQVIGTAFLGMTLGCARCHDHKFDPIPTRDYYALAGIFRSTRSLTPGNVSGWSKQPLPLSPVEQKKRDAYQEKLTLAKAHQKKIQQQISEMRKLLPIITMDDTDARLLGNWQTSTSVKNYLGSGYVHDQNQQKGEKSATFPLRLKGPGRYEVLFAYTPNRNRSSRVPVTVQHANGSKTVLVNQQQAPKIDDKFVSIGLFRFKGNNQDQITISNKGTEDGYVTVDGFRLVSREPTLTNDASEAVKKSLEQAKVQLLRLEKELRASNATVATIVASAPKDPIQIIAITEDEEPGDYHRLIRGNSRSLGEIVPRGFLQVVMQENQQADIPEKQSGRLELARWIASADNPLTARVYANRIWAHLFGRGLVSTVDNFGTKGEAPSHPKLLDYLARQLIENNWSTKQLIRKIVLSKTYRLSSQPTMQQRQKDPDNHYYARQNQRRLEAEALRDTILMLSGQLDLTMGGQTIREGTKSEYGYQFSSMRRSVYLPVFRNQLHDFLAIFDFPDPNLAKGKRKISTLSTQALYLMNSPFVLQQSRILAERLIKTEPHDRIARITDLYEQALGRTPSAAELKSAEEFLSRIENQNQSDRVQRWAALCQVVIASIDFRYVK